MYLHTSMKYICRGSRMGVGGLVRSKGLPGAKRAGPTGVYIAGSVDVRGLWILGWVECLYIHIYIGARRHLSSKSATTRNTPTRR